MSDAGIIQIVEGLKTQLTADDAPTVFTDRDDAEPIQPNERPARVIRVVDVSHDEAMERGAGSTWHVATIDIDHYADSDSADNLNSQLANMVAATVAQIGSDLHIGNKVFELTFVSTTANADDVPDAGVAILTFTAKFLTKLTDWTTIIF